MKVPYYDHRDKEMTYENNDYERINLRTFLDILDDKVEKDFEDLNGFNLRDEIESQKYQDKLSKYSPVNIQGDNFVEFKNFIIATKLLYMTGFTCNYGYWKRGELTDYGYTHHGIDLILPKGTPIVSFSDGIVENIKKRDGRTKNEGNCIIIKAKNNQETLFFCYEHLNSINVKVGQKVKQGETIGTCGNTGHSTTYHLHFQIDKEVAPFHPYWGKGEKDIEKTKKYCVDPWKWLRDNYKKKNNNQSISNENTSSNENNDDLITNILSDLEKNDKDTTTDNNSNNNANNSKNNTNTNSNTNNNKPQDDNIIDPILKEIEQGNKSDKDYIKFFVNAGILKGDNGDYKLKENITRYQITLILYRLKEKGLLKLNNQNRGNQEINFSDITSLKNDKEFIKALKFVVQNNILKGDNGKFLPWNNLAGEQFLAIVGRIRGNIKDGENIWYKPYTEWAEKQGIISNNWQFIGKSITREEVFKILGKLII